MKFGTQTGKDPVDISMPPTNYNENNEVNIY